METELLQNIKVSPTWGLVDRCSQVMLTDSVLCKHGSTVPLRLRWSGYASLSETNGHIMTRARWMMTIPVSSLAPLLYHSVPPRMPYFCLLTPISPVQRHFIGMKYTFLTILHITRETKSRASWISIVPSSSQRQSRITHLISRVIYHALLLPFFCCWMQCVVTRGIFYYSSSCCCQKPGTHAIFVTSVPSFITTTGQMNLKNTRMELLKSLCKVHFA